MPRLFRLSAALLVASMPMADAAFAQMPDGASTAWLVVGTDTWLGHRGQAEMFRVDGLGNPVVLVEATPWEMEALGRYVHESERRCGGFFSFPTRAEAEAFIAMKPPARAVPGEGSGYAISQQATVNAWIPQAHEPSIRATIASLESFHSRHYASATAVQAAEWIRDAWLARAAGREDVHVELFTDCNDCGSQPSVILTIEGSSLPDEFVVMGAHLDSTNGSAWAPDAPVRRSPGADDDASGIAVLTEVLRIAMATGYRPQRTVKFMAYAAEEVGLNGSQAIAATFDAGDADVYAVWQSDMTNYRETGQPTVEFMTDYVGSQLTAFVQQLFDHYLAPMGYTRGASPCGYGCSDHASWTQYGYPSVIAFEGGGLNHMSPYYHSANDDLAHMNNSAEHSVPFVQLGLAFLAETAKGRSTSILRDGFE